MKYWVCKTHENQVLFSEEEADESEKSKRLSIFPILSETPRECPDCGKYYYRNECDPKER